MAFDSRDPSERERLQAILSEKALQDLKDQTGDQHSEYYTQGLTNWLPELASHVQWLAAALEASVQERERLRDALLAIDVELKEGRDGAPASVPFIENIVDRALSPSTPEENE